jgi:Spy/CpxP family protein refolding chaperone
MHRHHGLFGSLNGPLAVTNDQFEKIFAIKNQAAEQITPKVVDLIAAKREMRDAMTEPNVDKSRVLGLQAKINGDKDAIANVKVASKLDELGVLTPDQRQQIRQSFVKWSVERGARRG